MKCSVVFGIIVVGFALGVQAATTSKPIDSKLLDAVKGCDKNVVIDFLTCFKDGAAKTDATVKCETALYESCIDKLAKKAKTTVAELTKKNSCLATFKGALEKEVLDAVKNGVAGATAKTASTVKAVVDKTATAASKVVKETATAATKLVKETATVATKGATATANVANTEKTGLVGGLLGAVGKTVDGLLGALLGGNGK